MQDLSLYIGFINLIINLYCFVANLAFTDNSVIVDSSKVGILVGSVVSGIIGYMIVKWRGNPKKGPILRI
ncbi:Na+/H+ antiporter NhaA [Zobellia uliginosa]|nr:Na+/H+ antiporter NhaA [Zobellia uliginosa]